MKYVQLMLVLWIGVLLFTACSDESLGTPKTEYKEDPVVAFQREVIPVLDETLDKYYPDDGSGNEMIEYATSYFDNENFQVVFLVYQYSEEMKAICKDLEEKLGDRVAFRDAKYSPKYLSDMSQEVTEYVDTMKGDGEVRSFVNYNPVDEVIEIEMLLSEQQIADLVQKFGNDILRITNKEPEPVIPL